MTNRPLTSNTPAPRQRDEGASENHMVAGLAHEASRSGVQRSAENADAWWWSPAWRGLTWLAGTDTEFQASDLTVLGVPDPEHPARWGALFTKALHAGLIEPVGYAPSKRPSRSGGVCRVWRGRPPG